MLHVPGLYILDTEEFGRGVYTSEPLRQGDMIELCPIIKIPTGQLEQIDKTKIYDYYFLWEEEGYEACIALGYGSLYNHNPHPNAEILLDYVDQMIKFSAIQDIEAGSEISIDYQDGNRDLKLWFKLKSSYTNTCG